VTLRARAIDAFATAIISVGGLGVIATVLGVFVYLVWVVLPLFWPGSLEVVQIVDPFSGLEKWGVEQSGREQSQFTNDLKTSELEQQAGGPTGANTAQSAESWGAKPPWFAGDSGSAVPDAESTAGFGRLGVRSEGAFQPGAPSLELMCDESESIAAVFDGKGGVRLLRLDTGEWLGETKKLIPEPTTAWHFEPSTGHWAAASGGKLWLGTCEFATEWVLEENLPTECRSLSVGKSALWNDNLLMRLPDGRFRLIHPNFASEPPVELTQGEIVLLDAVSWGTNQAVAAFTRDWELLIRRLTRQKNLLTGRTSARATGGSINVTTMASHGMPRWLFLSGLAENAFLVWADGLLLRVDTHEVENPQIAESLEVLSPPASALSSSRWMLGRQTLILGNDRGGLSGWFCVNLSGAKTSEGQSFVCAHEFSTSTAAVTALVASGRSRLIGVGYANGDVKVFYTTNRRLVAQFKLPDSEGVRSLAFSPKDSLLLVATDSRLYSLKLDAGHPEASLGAIFGRLWYEGYEKPEFVWQSSSGTDDFEPKYSLVPLIFGTFKATFYSLLFGVPIALLAAVYTSEFLHWRWRSRAKPAIEMMASLPSVVLGFLAALVVAPAMEPLVCEVLCAFGTIPVALLAGGYLWQGLPYRIRNSGGLRAIGIGLALAIGVGIAHLIGPIVENALFAGDIKLWLSGKQGGPWGGWVFLCLPLAALSVTWLNARHLAPLWRRVVGPLSRPWICAADLLRLFLFVILAVAVAATMAWILASIGGDPRGNLLGTYVQRNALVVGIIMGFAIIPIIFTIAEDALSSVPEHLRAASLGAGATPWQTAFRVVIPAATSGLFSAVMIGLGRAAGETMIVLMAAGNTPILEWNPFNGFRTLSANIAVELPEAVQNSTHYRMLFFAALCLFFITFFINTIAELVRLRFRRQAAQL